MGELPVPADAYYGAQTQRAVLNFPISGLSMPPGLVHAGAQIKAAAAQVNHDLDLLDGAIADAIVAAATEVAQGKLDDQFPIDVYQTGSGTSTNPAPFISKTPISLVEPKRFLCARRMRKG